MKDFQQISQHGTWLKIPQMVRKMLTQAKTFSSIKSDEHVFLQLPGTSDVRPQALRKHNFFISSALQWLSTHCQWILEKPLSLTPVSKVRMSHFHPRCCLKKASHCRVSGLLTGASSLSIQRGMEKIVKSVFFSWQDTSRQIKTGNVGKVGKVVIA